MLIKELFPLFIAEIMNFLFQQLNVTSDVICGYELAYHWNNRNPVSYLIILVC